MKKSLIRKLTVVTLVAVLVIGVYSVLDLGSYFSLSNLQQHQADLRASVDQMPVVSVVVFALLYYVTVALSLPFAGVLSLLAGFLFGALLGTVVVVTTATLGATTIFILARSFFGKILREKYSGRIDQIVRSLEGNAVGGLLFLRLVPAFPFFLVNLAPAFTRIRIQVFVVTTLVGILPGSFAYVYAGRSLGEIASTGEVLSTDLLLALSLLGVIAVLPSLLKWWRKARAPSSTNH